LKIVSPDDKPGELQHKVADYREFGIPYILLIYPEDPRFVLYSKDAEQELRDGVLRTENPAIEIPLLKIHRKMRG
jgi:Uma2 family endonuclease